MAQDEHTYGFSKADASDLAQMIGNGDGEYREGGVRGGGGGGSAGKIFLTPGGGIAARVGTSVSSATCTMYKFVGGTLTTDTTTAAVYNPWPVAIPAGFYLIAIKEDSTNQWVAMSPGVIDVRWVDPKLEQSLDKATYTTIDTAEDCS